MMFLCATLLIPWQGSSDCNLQFAACQIHHTECPCPSELIPVSLKAKGKCNCFCVHLMLCFDYNLFPQSTLPGEVSGGISLRGKESIRPRMCVVLLFIYSI